MSNKLDERITRIRFDNDQFERGVSTSLQSLDRLKNKLEATESVEAFSGITKAAEKTDLSGITKAIDGVSDKFSALRLIAINVLSDIAYQAMNTGLAMVKNLSVDNIGMGWEKYNQEVQAVQTIMVTLDDTPIEEVEKHLQKIGWFSDETSYSYEEMVGSMSKLISSGVSLEDATNAVIGLSNAAAAAGVSTKKAQQAFYNFSQAFGAGYMQLQDWRSIELLNMATPEFKNNIIRTAVELGKLVQVGDDLYSTVENLNDPDSWFSSASMRGSLKDKWFDNDVMNRVLNVYSEYANQVYEMQNAWDMDTASETMDQLDELGLSVDNVSNKAFRAAQEAKTFAEAIDSVKDAVSTKWKDTFKMLFGNYEEAKGLWTDLANELYDLFAASGDVRNDILKQWNDPLSFMVPDEKVRAAYKFPELQTGRDILVEGLWNIYYSIVNVVKLIKETWSEIFPQLTAKRLYELTKQFRDLTARLRAATEDMPGLKKFLTTIFSILKGTLNVSKTIIGSFSKLFPVGKKVAKILYIIFDQIADFFKEASSYFKVGEKFKKVIDLIKKTIEKFKNTILDFDENTIKLPTFKEFLDNVKNLKTVFSRLTTNIGKGIAKFNEKINTIIPEPILNGIKNRVSRICQWIKEKFENLFPNFASTKFGEKIGDIFSYIRDKFRKFLPNETIDSINASTINLEATIENFSIRTKPILENIKNFFINTWGTISNVFESIGSGIKIAFNWITEKFKGVTLRDVLTVGILGVMTWFEISLGKSVRRLEQLFDGLSSIFYSFSQLIKSKASEIRSRAVWNLATSILAIAGAIFVISKIDSSHFSQAVITVGIIGGVLLGINAVLIVLEKKLQANKGLAITYKDGQGLRFSGSSNRTGILSLVLGVIGMVRAIQIIDNMISKNNSSLTRINEIAKLVEHIAQLLLVCTVLMQIGNALGTKFAGGKFKSATLAPVAIASSMLIMIRVFEKLDRMKIENTEKVLYGVIGIMSIIFVLSLLTKKISSDIGLGMLGIVLSIYLAVIGLKKLQNIDIDLTDKGPIIMLIGGIILFLSLILKLAKTGIAIGKDQKFRNLKTNMLSIVGGLIACVGAIYVLSKLSSEELFRGSLAVINVLAALFGGVNLLLWQAGKMTNKVRGAMISMTGLVVVLTLLTTILSIGMYVAPAQVTQASIVVGLLLAFISGFIFSVGKITINQKVINSTSLLVAIIGAVVLALTLLTKNDPKQLITVVASFGALMLAVAATMLIVSKSSKEYLDHSASLLTFTAFFLAILSGVVIFLSTYLTNTNGLLKAAGAIAILGAVVTAVFGVISLIGKGEGKAVSAAFYGSLALAVVIAFIFGIVEILTTLFGVITSNFKQVEVLKSWFQEMVEIAYLIGSVVNAFVVGSMVGGLGETGIEIKQFVGSIEPIFDFIKNLPPDFPDKMLLLGKGLLNLRWFAFISTAFRGIGKETLVEKVVDDFLKVTPKIREIANEYATIDLNGLNAAKTAAESLVDIANSLPKLGLVSTIFTPNIALFTLTMQALLLSTRGLKEEDVTKVGYLTDILNAFGDIHTREYGIFKGFSGHESITRLATEVRKVASTMKDVIPSLALMNVDDLTKANENTPKLMELFTTVSTFVETIEKSGGFNEVLYGTHINTLGEYIVQISYMSKEIAGPLENLSGLNKKDINVASENTKSIMVLMDAVASIVNKLEKSGGFWQNIAGTHIETLGYLPDIVDSIVAFGRKMMAAENVTPITTAVNVTNSLADAFNAFATQALIDRLNSVAIAIRQLTLSGLDEVRLMYSDQESRDAVITALNNLIGQFQWVINEESKANRIAGYVAVLLSNILYYMETYGDAFYNEGVYLFNQFVAGITSESENVEKIGEDVADKLVSGTSSGLAARSPSKRMYELGTWAGIGLQNGLLSIGNIIEETGAASGDALIRGTVNGMISAASRYDPAKVYARIMTDQSLIRFNTVPITDIFKKLVGSDEEDEESLVGQFINEMFGMDIQMFRYSDLLKNLGLDDLESEFQSWLGSTMGMTDVYGELSKSAKEGAEITKGLLGNMPWLENMEETIDDTFSLIPEEGLIEKFFGEDYKNVFSDVESSMTGMIDELNSYSADYQNAFTNWNMSDYLSKLNADNAEYEIPFVPIVTDENGNQYSSLQDYTNMLSSGTSGTIAGYTSEDIRALTAEIYHLEDALYSLKEAMKDQQVTHTGELTIKYSSESDFIDRVQTAVIGNIRRGIRS